MSDDDLKIEELTPPLREAQEGPMAKLAEGVEFALNGTAKPKYSFALLVWKIGDPRANYIADADIAEVLAAMKQFIARNEGRYIPSQALNPTKRM